MFTLSEVFEVIILGMQVFLNLIKKFSTPSNTGTTLQGPNTTHYRSCHECGSTLPYSMFCTIFSMCTLVYCLLHHPNANTLRHRSSTLTHLCMLWLTAFLLFVRTLLIHSYTQLSTLILVKQFEYRPTSFKLGGRVTTQKAVASRLVAYSHSSVYMYGRRT